MFYDVEQIWFLDCEPCSFSLYLAFRRARPLVCRGAARNDTARVHEIFERFVRCAKKLPSPRPPTEKT